MISTETTPAKARLYRARKNPYRRPGRFTAPGDDPVPTTVHDVPLPNGLLEMQVVVTRLTDMPGWSKVATTWDGTECRMSPDDFDEQERHAPGEVMHAAVRIALHLLPPGDNGPSGSIYGALPLPDRLADLAARAMVDALAASCTSCLHRIELPVAAGGVAGASDGLLGWNVRHRGVRPGHGDR
jgi:hypothetical protein